MVTASLFHLPTGLLRGKVSRASVTQMGGTIPYLPARDFALPEIV